MAADVEFVPPPLTPPRDPVDILINQKCVPVRNNIRELFVDDDHRTAGVHSFCLLIHILISLLFTCSQPPRQSSWRASGSYDDPHHTAGTFRYRSDLRYWRAIVPQPQEISSHPS